MSNYSTSLYENDPNTPWYKVLKLIKRESTVLDYGCSSGNFGNILIKEKKCIVDGVELDKADARRAAKLLRKVFTNNIETEGDEFLGNRKYDVIYFGDVIEHLVNPVNVLKTVEKHLTPTGSVIFSIPNMAHMSVRLMLLKGEFNYGETGLLDKTHLHFYDKNEVMRIIQEAGYKLVKFDYVRRDIPRDVLTAELQVLGLKPTKRFLDTSKNIDSSAYQFIGAIKPSAAVSEPTKRPQLSPPINEMEKHIRYIKKVHKAQIISHKNRINELEAENKLLRQQQPKEKVQKRAAKRITSRIRPKRDS